MAFRERKRAKEKNKAGDGDKWMEDVRKGRGIRVNKARDKKAFEGFYEKDEEKKVVIDDYEVKEEVRGTK